MAPIGSLFAFLRSAECSNYSMPSELIETSAPVRSKSSRREVKKIGILTFHRCINYGAYWQARCLLEHLQSLGHDVRLLDHVSPRSIRREWPGLLRPTRPAPKTDVALSLTKIFRFLVAQQRLPRTRTFGPKRPPDFDDLDTIVVGSDEVWNIIHPWLGNEPLFFGEGLNPRRLISYAPSFGNYDAARGLPAAFVARLKRFHRISVRDQNSFRIVRDALKVEPAIVLDPCLQFFPAVFGESPDPAKSGYLLIYATRLAPGFVHQVREYARERQLRIVSVGYRHVWADESLPAAGPEDFLRCFQGAKAVVTSFFHGCVFSLRFGRPFVTQVPDYRANKVNGLLEVAGAQDRFIPAGLPFRPALLDNTLPAEVLLRIAQHRQLSTNYLEEALDG